MGDQAICPYCRMPCDHEGLVKIYCTGCGTPHHEDCYQENGGCTVFGCSRAPADDPKLQVSSGELRTALPIQPGMPTSGYAPVAGAAPQAYPYGPVTGQAYGQPGYALHAPRNRTSFILLGIFLGMFGAHNFYAGYKGKAIGQLCLTILTLFYLGIVSWIWAVIEVCVIDKDNAGVRFQ